MKPELAQVTSLTTDDHWPCGVVHNHVTYYCVGIVRVVTAGLGFVSHGMWSSILHHYGSKDQDDESPIRLDYQNINTVQYNIA